MTPQRAGVYVRDSDYTQRVSTANGLARVAPVMLDRVSIGDITVRNVPAAVTEPGKLMTSPARHVVPEPPAARRHARRRPDLAGVIAGPTRTGLTSPRSICHMTADRGFARCPSRPLSSHAATFGSRLCCRGFDLRHASQAARRSQAQHGRFRAPAARQADRLSRIRRALAVPAGHQPDGPQRHRPGARHAGRPARRAQALRRRPRLPLLFGRA